MAAQLLPEVILIRHHVVGGEELAWKVTHPLQRHEAGLQAVKKLKVSHDLCSFARLSALSSIRQFFDLQSQLVDTLGQAENQLIQERVAVHQLPASGRVDTLITHG